MSLILGSMLGFLFALLLCAAKLSFYKAELAAEHKYSEQMFDLYDKEIDRLRSLQ